jgi:hypothetical protein
MPTKPSKNDLTKVAQFLKLVRARKPLSQSGYDSLMSCRTLPRYILNHIDTYYRRHQSGGAEEQCCTIWPEAAEKGNCPPCDSLDLTSPNIGEGAYGKVVDGPQNTVIKYFKLEDQKFVDYLIFRLPRVFEKISYNNVYQELFTYSNPPKIAYKMVKLEVLPLERIFYRDNQYNLLLKIIIHKINELHKMLIVHCDMKIDNVMFDGDPKMRLNDLFSTLGENLKIIDFDGCIFYDSLKEDITEGYTYHPTTPAFAHSFLIEHLYCKDPVFSRIDHINSIRNICGSSIDHDEYHKKIFPETPYETLFPENISEVNNEKLFKFMKFCDYYNMAISLLHSKLLYNKKFNETYPKEKYPDEPQFVDNVVITSTCNLLKMIATKLGIDVQPPPTQEGARKRKQRGGTVCIKPTVTKPLKDGEYVEFEVGGQPLIHSKDPSLLIPEIMHMSPELEEKYSITDLEL